MILVRKTCDSRIVVTVLKYIVSLNTMEVGDAENQLFLLMLGRTMDMLMGKGERKALLLLLLRAAYRRTFASAARRAELRA